jgi:hypothetical protein
LPKASKNQLLHKPSKRPNKPQSVNGQNIPKPSKPQFVGEVDGEFGGEVGPPPGVKTQTALATLQVSIVFAFLSLHWALLWQFMAGK